MDFNFETEDELVLGFTIPFKNKVVSIKRLN